MKRIVLAPALVALALSSCAKKPETEPVVATKAAPPPAKAAAKPTPADAKKFIAETDVALKKVLADWERSEFVKATYITHDTETIASQRHERYLAFMSQAIQDATKYDGLELDADTARRINLLKVAQSMPAPNDPVQRKKLADLASRMSSIYGKGKYCRGDDCRALGELSKVLANSHDYDELLDAWQGWRTISVEMRPMYEEFVSVANDGARELGFADLGVLWRGAYDMSSEEFEAETERLWQQVKPLYEALHCHVRAQLAKKYGKKVDPKGKIPAHLLGNMWAQEWGNIYPLVEPYRGQASLDVTSALEKKKYSATDMVKMGEKFFTSLGLDPLPETFWERSMFTKPADREVVCHASAWDVAYDNDLRIKMCITPTEEDFITIHHELGHNYYYMYYHQLPVLYQAGAHDGFHEGIGDTLALSVTPGYLKDVGILKKVAKNDKALINYQMKVALDKIAFLPFGKLIDQWRWDVFSGKVGPDDYNAAWWKLREDYQGIQAPVARSEKDFDPGAKYHVPSNVPYTRYFLARILQFQFYRAMCKIAGHEGPLHECSFFGSQEAGAKLKAMLAMGASRPWPEALEALTGERQMDATAMIDYFAPLSAWLAKQNEGRTCGW
ncbi:MAG: M2 family metallopeptidase [Deltaproteobacteria bacterium]|jgi:peptidyl-dipeptidase A